jgi:hypothetical protein
MKANLEELQPQDNTMLRNYLEGIKSLSILYVKKNKKFVLLSRKLSISESILQLINMK